MTTADVWIKARFNGKQDTEGTRQAALQKHFVGQLGTVGDPKTQRLLKKMYWRVGKLFWRASAELTSQKPPFSIKQWGSTNRENAAEEILQMNCWEAILYMAYQCSMLSKSKIRALYSKKTHHSAKLASFFGTSKQYGTGTPNPGDILTFFNNTKGEIDHVAIYVGDDANGTPHLIHNLAWCARTTGIEGQGCIHFETVANATQNYAWSMYGPVTVHYTAPFWLASSPTNAYVRSL